MVDDSKRRGSKGFYMSIDISIAVALTIIIMIMLLYTFANVPRSEMVQLANYKAGEASLYVMAHDGTLDSVVGYLDDSNEAQARAVTINAMTAHGLTLNSKLTVVAYDESLTPVHIMTAQNGPMVRKAYGISIPFKANGTTSKYVVATLVVGQE